jgi:hypothetical protein
MPQTKFMVQIAIQYFDRYSIISDLCLSVGNFAERFGWACSGCVVELKDTVSHERRWEQT